MTEQGRGTLDEGGQSTASSGTSLPSSLGAGLGFFAIMFTDIVESTDHRSRLGDARADAMHAEVETTSREAIERHRGVVVKGLGDGLMAIFRSSTEAVLASVAIQRRLARRSRTSPVDVRLRIGIGVGEVDVTDDDVFGYPVNEASRLCSACADGGILVSELAANLARRADVEYVEPREVFVTPSAPATVALLVAVGHEEAPLIPLSGSLDFAAHGGRFVGRKNELQTLLDLWHRATEGSMEVAVVTGEPGLGKTTLLGEFAREVARGTGVVLYGRCDERVSAPYQPFAEAFGHFVEHCPRGDLEALLGANADELSRLVPALAGRSNQGAAPRFADLESERWRLHDAIAGALRSVSSFEPAVLILDDLHWAGATTVDLLGRILRDTSQSRLMVVLSLRSWDPAMDPDVGRLVADRHRLAPNVVDVVLGGLEPGEVSELAAEWKHQTDVDARQARELWEVTAGHPLFVSQLLRTTGDDELVPIHVPRGVAEVIERQLDRLTSTAKSFLRVAAVLGHRFEVQVAAQVAQIAVGEAFDCLDEAALAGLVKPLEGTPLRYEFSHALVRRALEDQLTAGRRRDFHARLAALLEDASFANPDDQVRRLAFHWSEAGEFGDPAKGVTAGLRAIEIAIGHLAIKDAMELLERVTTLASLVHEPRRDAEVAVVRAEAMCLGALPDARTAQLAAVASAEDVGDAALLARAALAHTRGYFSAWGRSDAQRLRALELALEACDVEERAMRARLMARLANELSFDDRLQRRFQLADDAVDLARSLGDAAILANVLMHRQYILGAPQFLDVRLREGRELEAIAVTTNDRLLEMQSCRLLCAAYTESADVERLDHSLDRLRQLNDEFDLAGGRWEFASVRTSRALFAGELKLASSLVKEAFTLGTAAGQPDVAIFAGAQLMQLNYLRGRLPSIIDTFLEAIPDEVKTYLIAWVARQIHLAGRVEDAEEWWRRTQEIGLDAQMEIGVNAGLVLTSWAYLASTLPTSQEVLDQLRLRLTPLADQLFQQLAPDQPGHHFLALLADAAGDGAGSDEHFAASLTLLERAGAPVMAAITQVAWARSLRGRGDVERARSLAARALATARTAGATQIEVEAVAIMEGSS